MLNGAERDRPQLHAAPTICDLAFIQQILNQLPAGRAACNQIHPLPCGGTIITEFGFHLVGGRELHLLLMRYGTFRGLTCPAEACPRCCRQCPALHAGLQQWQTASEPGNPKPAFGDVRVLGIWGLWLLHPMLSAASPASTSSPNVRSPMLQGPAHRADSWDAVTQAGTLSPR